jgi:hypothetical protein
MQKIADLDYSFRKWKPNRIFTVYEKMTNDKSAIVGLRNNEIIGKIIDNLKLKYCDL